ncbi:MAG: radical SAM protein [Dehalococcoidia bacterium]|nr:radical SAM protein [Dehalococcoidia bacterium]
MSHIRNVMLVAPKSTGGNFEYVAIPRQGPLYISGALKQWHGEFLYDRDIWYEDRNGKIDPDKDLEDVDILMVTALINEAPRAYEITRAARESHPELKIIGGGPHMSPLAEEALRYGKVDVVVIREGEDVVGQLCDVMVKYTGDDLTAHLHKVPGIAFLDGGKFAHTEKRGLIPADYVKLPDFDSMRDLTPRNPLAAGVLETVRGCTEKCTFCQVIQQFLGYRMVSRETELLRLAQIHKLAEDGKIYTAKDGRFSVFISDDLHPPPLRATKFRDERLARLKSWKGHSDDMWMICQTRAEVGQDPELAQAMRQANIEMLYLGVESSSAENLKIIRKRQDPTEVHRDLVTLNKMGFIVAAMTIIGLPYDTEAGIMEMADWVKTVSRYQTANWLTPLPATVNWNLTPLDEDGSVLPEDKMRPYHMYTGRQFVFQDKRWGMQEAQEIYAKYTGRLHPVDKMYERIFRMFRSRAYDGVIEQRRTESVASISGGRVQELAEPRIGQLEESVFATLQQTKESVLFTLKELTNSVSAKFGQTTAPGVSRSVEMRNAITARVNNLEETISLRMEELNDTLSTKIGDIRASLSSTREGFQESLAFKADELGKSVSVKLGELRTSASTGLTELMETLASRKGGLEESFSAHISELGESVSVKLGEMGDSIAVAMNDFKGRLDTISPPRRSGITPSR